MAHYPPVPLKPGKTYHIWTHANGSENIFREKKNYGFFLDRYRRHIVPVADTFAYCLMPNHLHLLVRVKANEELMEVVADKKGASMTNLQGFENQLRSSSSTDLTGFKNLSGLLSKQFSNLFNSYTKAFNKQYGRSGSLFARPFKRHPITSRTYFLNLLAYIHLNPVHHGFVEQAHDWPHSSWHAYRLDKHTELRKDEVIQLTSGMESFLKLHQNLDLAKFNDLFAI